MWSKITDPMKIRLNISTMIGSLKLKKIYTLIPGVSSEYILIMSFIPSDLPVCPLCSEASALFLRLRALWTRDETGLS
jgi:hypothetical protein